MPSTVNLKPDYPDKQIAKPEALHTAARRYLMDQMDTDRSMTWVRGRDADGTLRIDVRYLHSTAGAAIEEQVERIGPSNYRSLEDLRAVLLQIGRTADDPYLRQVTDPSELSKIECERGQFCEYISGLSPAGLRLVKPLPYRRLLSERESRRLWHKLDKRWGTSFDSYWYPLREAPPFPRSPAVAGSVVLEGDPTKPIGGDPRQTQGEARVATGQRLTPLRLWGI